MATTSRGGTGKPVGMAASPAPAKKTVQAPLPKAAPRAGSAASARPRPGGASPLPRPAAAPRPVGKVTSTVTRDNSLGAAMALATNKIMAPVTGAVASMKAATAIAEQKRAANPVAPPGAAVDMGAAGMGDLAATMAADAGVNEAMGFGAVEAKPPLPIKALVLGGLGIVAAAAVIITFAGKGAKK